MNSPPFNAHTTPLFRNCNILKFADIINVESFILINNCFNKDSFLIFKENLKSVSTTHSYSSRLARNGLLFVPSYNTVRFSRKSIIHSTTLPWNYLHDKLTKYNFLCLKPKSLKTLLVKFFISEYATSYAKTATSKSNEPVVIMIIYYEYEIVYIYIDDM